MEIFEIIKFEGDDSTLVWKYPKEDFNTLSQLIVHESQEAILFKDGQALDLFGPGRHTLKTENIPLLRKIVNLPTDGESPFHCEVYFINKALALNVKWGTSSQFSVLDPMFNVPLKVGASGSLELKVEDARKFLVKVVGTQNKITTDDVVFYFKEKIVTKVKAYLSKLMGEINYLAINQHLEEISEALHNKLKEDLENYGVSLEQFYLSTINIPEEDTFKIKEVLNKKLEYGTLNYNWADEQMAEIAKKYASNPGNNDVGGVVSQIPIALAFGRMLEENISPMITNTFSKKVNNIENNVTNQYCSNCGKSISKESKFCSNCGEKIKNLENIKLCIQCGNQVKEEDKFCNNCGNKIKGE